VIGIDDILSGPGNISATATYQSVCSREHTDWFTRGYPCASPGVLRTKSPMTRKEQATVAAAAVTQSQSGTGRSYR
jgi:hypothetical protein